MYYNYTHLTIHAPDYYRVSLKKNSEVHRYETRSASKLYVPVQPRRSAAIKMFLFREITLWNSLAPEQKELPYKMFCESLNSELLLRQLTSSGGFR
jgi:hypothetical protein